MDIGEIVAIVLMIFVGILIITIVIINLFFKRKKGTDTPEDLKIMYKIFIDIFEMTPIGLIFEYYSNDGSCIIYKEKTTSRNVFLSIERDNIKLIQNDNNGNVIYTAKSDEEVWGFGVTDDAKILDIIHNLYIFRLKQ